MYAQDYLDDNTPIKLFILATFSLLHETFLCDSIFRILGDGYEHASPTNVCPFFEQKCMDPHKSRQSVLAYLKPISLKKIS
jgi:hypothetical protein